jgi:hypothetical protein
MIPVGLLQAASDLVSKLPPEALPILENLAKAGVKLATHDKAAALEQLQAAERALNAEIAMRIVDRDRP